MDTFLYLLSKLLPKIIGLIVALTIIAAHADNPISSATDRQRKPNIILIVADDMGYGELGSYGHPTMRTPNLDAMAEGGMMFTDFHANGPLCTPTRAALLTGRYQQRVGVKMLLKHQRYAGAKALPLEEITFAEVLKSAGYTTGIFGKWHLGDKTPFLPTGQGFDDYFGLPYSNDMHPWKLNNRYPPLPLIRNEEIVELNPDQNYLTRRYTNEAVAFIEQNRNKPFLVYLAHSMPHRPIHASERFTERFTREQLASIKGLDKRSRDFLHPAAIEEIDWSTGEILKTLRELGINKHTLVMFTSDNGPTPAGSAHPLRGRKGSLREGGHRVPFIAYWPGRIKAGSVTNAATMTMDLLPTMAELADVDPPAGVDGVSLVPLFLGGKKLPERTLFWRNKRGKQKAVRKGPWKLLISPAKIKKNQAALTGLYNLDEDIGEENNLAQKYPKIFEELQTELEGWEEYVDAGGKQKVPW